MPRNSFGKQDQGVSATDSPSIDAFGRWRVSNPITIFDSKQIFDNAPLFWDDAEVSGSGTGSSHSTDTASTTMSVSANTAGNRVRQTFMRFNYQPGKSQLILMTGTLGATGGGDGITRMMGLYDDDNGLFFKDNEGTVQVVKRSSTSGSAVDTAVSQSSWNLDPLDGTGPSGYTLDATKSQIGFIDFEWLGVGRVRMGFVIDGKIIYVHEFLHSNRSAGVYMSTPNLPLRYEIDNDGTGAASTLEHICCSVETEGGLDRTGPIFSTNTGAASVNANSVGTYYALCGLKLKTTHLDATVKLIADTVVALTGDPVLWEVRWNPTVAGTFTYSDVTNSAVQTATGDTSGNPSTNTVTGGEVIRSGYVAAGNSAHVEVSSARHLGVAIDGTRDEYVLCVSPMSTNLDVAGSLTWRELL